jgi:hypothetical protein
MYILAEIQKRQAGGYALQACQFECCSYLCTKILLKILGQRHLRVRQQLSDQGQHVGWPGFRRLSLPKGLII